jgi:hypothetical protein
MAIGVVIASLVVWKIGYTIANWVSVMVQKYLASTCFIFILMACPIGSLSYGDEVLLAGSGSLNSYCSPSDGNCQAGTLRANRSPFRPLLPQPLDIYNPTEDLVRSPRQFDVPTLRNNIQRKPLDDQNYLLRNERLPSSGTNYSGELYRWSNDQPPNTNPDYYRSMTRPKRLNHAVACREARNILKIQGFQNIQVISCGGNYHKLKATKKGVNYLLKVRKTNGDVVVVRRYK